MVDFSQPKELFKARTLMEIVNQKYNGLYNGQPHYM